MLDAIVAVTETSSVRAKQLSQQLSAPVGIANDKQCQLLVDESGIRLQVPELGNPFYIDFEAGKYDHRRKFGGGRGQPFAKAIGLKKGQTPTVIDATAGFARDAFVLATLGCCITLLERNVLMSVLIEDALLRAAQNAEISEIIQRMCLFNSNAVSYLQQLTPEYYPDVIYMDPMYPSRDKSALVKKDMQLLHQLVGADTDSDALLGIARQRARQRVVVKRPKGAEFVGNNKPAISIASKNTRYDVYVTY